MLCSESITSKLPYTAVFSHTFPAQQVFTMHNPAPGLYDKTTRNISNQQYENVQFICCLTQTGKYDFLPFSPCCFFPIIALVYASCSTSVLIAEQPSKLDDIDGQII